MQYDLNLTANGGQQINAVGHFIKYKIGIGPIRVKTDAGVSVDLTPGQGVRCSKPFSTLTVIDRSGTNNIGVLLAGDYEFQDDSIAGTVSIIDGGKASSLAGNCFMGSVQSGAVAGNYNHVALTNPAGSGKNLIVEAVVISPEAAGPVMMSVGQQRGFLATTTNDNLYSGAYTNMSRSTNKANTANAGLQGNVATLRGQYLSSNVYLSPMLRARVLLGAPLIYKFAEPIIIQPDKELCIFTLVAGLEVGATIEWREDGA